jgi:hypothetical protein
VKTTHVEIKGGREEEERKSREEERGQEMGGALGGWRMPQEDEAGWSWLPPVTAHLQTHAQGRRDLPSLPHQFYSAQCSVLGPGRDRDLP